MKCPLCGLVFTERDAQTACAGCIMAHKCGLVRCPNCGYEMALEPRPKPKLVGKDETPNAAH